MPQLKITLNPESWMPLVCHMLRIDYSTIPNNSCSLFIGQSFISWKSKSSKAVFLQKKTLFSLDFASHSCPSGCAPQLAGRWSSSAAERSAGVRAPSPKRNCRARSAALAKSCGASEASAEMLLFVARAQTKTSADWLWEILEVLPHSHKCYAASRHQVQPILRIDHHERWFRHCGLLKICLERCNVHVHKQKVAWI